MSSTGSNLNGASLLVLPNPYSKLGEVLGARLNRRLYVLDLIYRAYVTYFRPEGVSTRRRYLSAFTIGMGYTCTPPTRRRDHIDSYFFIPTAHIALKYSRIFTGIVLLVFSAVKARITSAASKRADGYVWGSKYIGGRRCCGRSGIWHSRTHGGEGIIFSVDLICVWLMHPSL